MSKRLGGVLAPAVAPDSIVRLTWLKDSDGTAAANLSVSQHTPWMEWPQGAVSAELYWGNTGVTSPVGVRSIYVSGHGDLTKTTAGEYDPQPLTHPTGAAGSLILPEMTRQGRYLQCRYTAIDGGAGAHHTDDTEVDGTSAYIVFHYGA